MSDKFADIRKRLEAVAWVNWNDTDDIARGEYVGDWHGIGPVMVPTVFDPVPQGTSHAKDMSNVAWFIQHAAEDIRRLLEEVQEP